MYYWVNAYFDPEPKLYPLASKFLACIGISIALFTLYCILMKSPKEVTTLYKGLLIYSQTSFLLAQAIVSIGMVPVIMLPYSAFYSLGLFTSLNIPTVYHLVSFMWIAVSCGASMVSLFFYKMDVLIDRGHPYRRILNYCRFLVYSIALVLCHIITPIGWTVYFSFTNQDRDKLAIAEELGVFTDKLFEPTTVVMAIIHPSKWMHYVELLLCGAALLLCLVTVAICATVSLIILHNKRSSMSEKTREMHKAWLTGHILQVLVVLTIFGGFLVTLVVSCYIKSNRADLINIGAIIYPQTSPICSVILLFCSKTYTRYVFELFGLKKSVKRKNTTVFVTIEK